MLKLNTQAFASPVSSADYSTMISTLAGKVVARRMAVPTVLFLESTKPVNRLLSQMLIVLSPLIGLFVSYGAIDAFCDMLQDRANINTLIAAIEQAEEKWQNQPNIHTLNPEP